VRVCVCVCMRVCVCMCVCGMTHWYTYVCDVTQSYVTYFHMFSHAHEGGNEF